MSNTRIAYSYQDPSGNEVLESLVLVGRLTDADGAAIAKTLHQNQYFIPSQVGLENLQERLGREIANDDSIWHRWEWRGMQDTEDAPTTDLLASTLVESFEYARWNELQATAELFKQPIQKKRMAMRM